jgi:hypothetical protein
MVEIYTVSWVLDLIIIVFLFYAQCPMGVLQPANEFQILGFIKLLLPL